MTTALISLPALKSFVELQESDVRFDTILNGICAGVSEMIELYCERLFEKVARVELHPSHDVAAPPLGVESDLIWLNAYPLDLAQPLTVTYNYYGLYAAGAQSSIALARDTTFFVDTKDPVIRCIPPSSALVAFPGSSGFCANPAGFVLTSTGGFAVNDDDPAWPYLEVPGGLSTACAIQTGFLFRSFARGSLGLGTAGGEKDSTQKDKRSIAPQLRGKMEALIPEVTSMLRPFVRRGPMVGRGY